MQKTFIIAVLLSAVFLLFPAQSSAYTQTLTSVRMNPETLTFLNNDKQIPLSALAFDQYGLPIWSGVTYEWGISSSATIGRVYTDPGGKTVMIKIIGSGEGDVYVIARHAGNHVTQSTSINIGNLIGACAADIDSNTKVNLADYTLLAKYFLRWASDIPTPRADIDGSGRVNLKDYTILAREYGNTCP